MNQLLVFGLFIAFLFAGLTNTAAPVPVRTIAKGGFSGIQTAHEEVIGDAATWQVRWREHSVKGEKQPEIDFSKEMVVLVTMGRKQTGGYAIGITGVENVGDKLKITVARKSPPPGTITIQALTAPFHFVAIPRTALQPEFVIPIGS